VSTPLANQPAFPVVNPGGGIVAKGLNAREYFAGLAMQGLVSAYNSSERIVGLSHDAEAHGETKVEQTLARWAVDQADALLAALESDCSSGEPRRD